MSAKGRKKQTVRETDGERRRPYRAVSRRQYTDDLRNRFIEGYASDPEFVGRLIRFVRQYSDKSEDLGRLFIRKVYVDIGGEESYAMTHSCDWEVVRDEGTYGDSPLMKQYFTSVEELSQSVGLDCLPYDKGGEAIHSWFCAWLQNPNYPTALFGKFLYSTMVSLDPPPETRLTGKGREVIIDVSLTGGWKWFSESPGDAKKRLGDEAQRLVEQEIDRIAAAMEQNTYVFPQDRDEEGKHLRWLYRRVRYRDSCDAIAGQGDGGTFSSGYIQKITKARAVEMGIEIPHPHKRD